MRLYGGPAQAYECDAEELLLEGGVRTGKSHAAMEKSHIACETWPGMQILFTRETRKALSTTILPDFERFVLGPNHAAISGTALPENRTAYRYPNGSKIDLIGMDDPGKILSGQWDWIVWFQAERGNLKAWKMLKTRLSERNGPYNQIIGDVNPAEKRNYLNVRGDQYVCHKCGALSPQLEEGNTPRCCDRWMVKLMRRIKTKQRDNPILFDHHVCRDCGHRDTGDWEKGGTDPGQILSCRSCGRRSIGDWTPFGRRYMRNLHGLTGVERDRYLYHKWVSAEGLIFTEYEHGSHHVALSLDVPGFDGHRRTPLEQEDGEIRHVLDFDDYFATFDWGYVDPACLCIWGVIGPRLYRVWEGYMTGKEIARRTGRGGSAMDWWCDRIDEVDQEIGGLDAVLCDAKPEFIDKLNDVLGEGGRRTEAPAMLTPYRGKGIGIDSVKRHLAPLNGGPPLLYLCHDATRWGIESSRHVDGLPLGTEDEFESYVWEDPDSAKRDKDQPADPQEDHAMDNVQWACLYHEHIGPEQWARAHEPPDLGEDVLDIRETLEIQ
jgi:hypothetical protein